MRVVVTTAWYWKDDIVGRSQGLAVDLRAGLMFIAVGEQAEFRDGSVSGSRFLYHLLSYFVRRGAETIL